MKLWSKGLGRTEIEMDFRRYLVTKEPSSRNVWISGHIVDPVKWEFRITMTPEDIPGIIKLAFNPLVIKLLLVNSYRYIRYLFHRKAYEPADPRALLDRVDRAYDNMVNNARPRGRRRPGLRRGAVGDIEGAPSSAAGDS